MSNKLCYIFLIFANILISTSVSRASVIAYDEKTSSVIEIIDLEYDRYSFVQGQLIEYYDLEDFQRKWAIIDEVEDNFTLITLKIIDNKTKKTRNLIIRLNN